MGLGSNYASNMLERVLDPINHTVFSDNYFTKYKLMHALTEKSFCATATVRKNPIPNYTN